MKLHDLRIERLREPNQCHAQHRFCCETSDVCENQSFPKTETIGSHSSRAGNPSSLGPVSSEMISDSVEL